MSVALSSPPPSPGVGVPVPSDSPRAYLPLAVLSACGCSWGGQTRPGSWQPSPWPLPEGTAVGSRCWPKGDARAGTHRAFPFGCGGGCLRPRPLSVELGRGWERSPGSLGWRGVRGPNLKGWRGPEERGGEGKRC